MTTGNPVNLSASEVRLEIGITAGLDSKQGETADAAVSGPKQNL